MQAVITDCCLKGCSGILIKIPGEVTSQEGEWLDVSKEESLVLSEEVARTLNLQLGDTVYGLFPKPDTNAQQRRFVVSGLFNSNMLNSIDR